MTGVTGGNLLLAWFALAWGYLGRTLGLITAFDNVAAAGEIKPNLIPPPIRKFHQRQHHRNLH